MAKLVELPNGACVDANHVIEISNPYLVKDKYMVRVSIDNGMILRHVNAARGG